MADFCGRTRREFLWEAGAASPPWPCPRCSATRLPGASQAVAADGTTHVRQSARPQEAALRRPRPRASSSSSCTAAPATSTPSTTSRSYERLDGKTIAGEDVRPRRPEERGPHRRAAVEVQAVRPVRQVGQRPVSAPGHLRRRHRLPPLDDGRLADPRLGHAADEHGQDPLAAARASARGSTTAWAASTRTCPASSSCSIRRGGPISGAKNWSSGYMPATYQGDDPALGRHADPRPEAAART